MSRDRAVQQRQPKALAVDDFDADAVLHRAAMVRGKTKGREIYTR